MANMKQHKLGWIGIGRMGYAMAERLAKARCDISVWNRTRAKAEPLAAHGAKIVDSLAELAACDIVFTMVSTGKDVKEVLFGPQGVTSRGKAPKIVVNGVEHRQTYYKYKYDYTKDGMEGHSESTTPSGSIG